jgi:hypothetical protein
MTEPNRSLTELPALLQERRRYEGWLAALDARRDSTPAHVFDRVKADYEHRLGVVAERLAAHRHAIEEERTSLESRRSLLEAEEQLRRDERAELELRAHVGELDGGDADAAFRTVDEALETLTSEKESLTSRIAELQGLLTDDRGAAPTEAAEGAPEPEQQHEPEPEPITATATAPVAEPPGAEEPATEQAPPAAAAQPEPPLSPPEAAHLHVPDGATARPRPASGSFDELAFLSGVVGSETPKSAPLDDKRIDSALDEVLGSAGGGRRSGEAPLASNIPANTPIVLRSSGSMEQSKTLKCTDCGAMNYPTEWYCERCGAELAAL